MHCPKCGDDALVLETRLVAGRLRRRRRCRNQTCKHRFTSIEVIVEASVRNHDAVILVVPGHIVRHVRDLISMLTVQLGDDPEVAETDEHTGVNGEADQT